MNLNYDIEIGRSKRARRTYSLDEVALVPSRRTRAVLTLAQPPALRRARRQATTESQPAL